MKISSPILQRLGSIPFWRGEQRCLDALDKIYRQATERAQKTLRRTSREQSKKENRTIE